MKIAFLTVHVGFNFGSVLQAIATSHILKQFADDVILINYIPERVTYKRYLLKNRTLIGFLRQLKNLDIFYRNNKIFDKDLRRFCQLTRPYYNSKQLADANIVADYYITGSDQVWNSIHNEGFNPIYFFSFISSNAKILSFSSSFGVDNLDAEEEVLVKKMLSRYRGISVRESSAKIIIEKMGLNVTHLLDPTFLLSKGQWEKYLNPPSDINNYLLVYTPYNIVSKELVHKVAHRIAEEYDLKIVTFSWNKKEECYADRTIKFASPLDFLTLMYHANFVLTNSFHGTAFSINLNKQFCVLRPSSFVTRINSILKLTSLEHRLIDNIPDRKIFDNQIDYAPINSLLEYERDKAFSFLKQNIT